MRPLAAAITLLFVAVACTSDVGPVWTLAPASEETATSAAQPESETIEDDIAGDTAETAGTTEPPIDKPVSDEPTDEPTDEPIATDDPVATTKPAATIEPVATTEPVATDEPAATTEPVASEAPGAARPIDLIAAATILFTTPEGDALTEIAVTPGETVLFRIDNTAGFGHSFYIGTPDVVSAGNATTDAGTPVWNSGVREVEWVVPEDVTTVEFACTVAGHYTRMHGTFSVSS